MRKEKLGCCENNSSKKQINELSEFLGVISNKNRFRIICVLNLGKRCVCDLYEYLNLSQNLTSYHLKFLEEKGIVSWEKKGAKVFYKLNNKKVEDNIKLLNKFFKIYE